MVSVCKRFSPTPERKKGYRLDQALVADRRSKGLEANAIVRNRGFWLITIILVYSGYLLCFSSIFSTAWDSIGRPCEGAKLVSVAEANINGYKDVGSIWLALQTYAGGQCCNLSYMMLASHFEHLSGKT